jgi:hypothetical protein
MSREALEAAKRAKEAAKIFYQQEIQLDDENGNNGIFVFERVEGSRIHVATEAAETFTGGAARDLVSYHTSTAGVTLRLNEGSAQLQSSGGTAAGDKLIRIEDVIGSDHRDIIHGNSQDNIIFGQGGVDTINGNGGFDFLFGGAGGDTINATVRANEAAYLDGGSENDILTVKTFGGDADVVTGSGIDKVIIEARTGDHFEVRIKDFQPFFERTTVPTFAESLRGDQLVFRLNANVAPGEDLRDYMSTAANDPRSDNPDFIIDFFHPAFTGRIILEDFRDFVGFGDFNFLPTFETFTPPPAPV